MKNKDDENRRDMITLIGFILCLVIPLALVILMMTGVIKTPVTTRTESLNSTEISSMREFIRSYVSCFGGVYG